MSFKRIRYLALTLLLALPAWGQIGYNLGTTAISCNAVSATGICTSYSLPAPNGQLPSSFTWQVITTGGPATISTTFEGSLDAVTWTVLDTSTVVGGEMRSFGGKPIKFVRCNLGTLTGGAAPTVTCQFTTTTAASTGGSGGGLPAGLTFAAPTLTVSQAGLGNGQLALSGNTSGVFTITAPAVAGTPANPATVSNVIQFTDGTISNPAWRLTTSNTGPYWGTNNPGMILAAGGTDLMSLNSKVVVPNTGNFGFSQSTSINQASFNQDTTISRLGAGITQFGSGATTGKNGFVQSGMTVFVTADFTTSGVGTALENITGLTWTFPATAANWSFHCHYIYHQNVAVAAVAFGIQSNTNAPTQINATGEQFTSATALTAGVLTGLATTTATNIVSATPSAITTDWVADLYGTMELPASAHTINLMTSTATAADTVTVRRGSYCALTP